ncbi:hypothetical protein [Thauera sp. SDU_THAU2]|uniref:hypothetical protein n=1 Tax=Thauera sp. SDU_THAU2 TaxID=3136633 RepID=UPI00311F095C
MSRSSSSPASWRELVAYSSRVIVLRDRAHVAELAGERVTTADIVEVIAASGERSAS